MLSYKNRFHGYNSLRFVYKNGDVVRGKLLTVKYSKNPRRKTPRVSVVVSKKVLKSAVGRNRIRRRIYEQIRVLLPDITPQLDLVCIVSSNELKILPTTELQSLIDASFREASIYIKPQENATL